MASASEQNICIKCGFCCDGTLFHRATLDPGEKGNLPEFIERNYFLKDKQEFFKLPCSYFNTKCTIYNQKKAHICSAFRCQLLRNFSNQKISSDKAISLVENAVKTRNELINDFVQITGKNEFGHFEAILKEIGNIQKTDEGLANTPEFNILVARCNIFQTLLIKYFESEKNFDTMKANNSTNENI